MTNSPIRSFATATCLMALATAVPPQLSAQQENLPDVTIGMVLDGPMLRYGDLVDLVRDETLTLLGRDYDARIPDAKILEGDWTVPGISSALDRLLADPEVSVVIAAGAISGHIAAMRRDLPKPVVAPYVIDDYLQSLPRAGEATGVANLVYVARPEAEDLSVFLEIAAFERPAVLISESLAEAISGLPERVREATAGLGLDPAIVTVGANAEEALTKLAGGNYDAVYVLPLPRLSVDQFDELAVGLIDLQLPSFSWFGAREVRRGILAGQKSDGFGLQIARLTALNVQRILRGDPADLLPVDFVPQEVVVINMATARQIGVYPSWKILTEAELIADEERFTDRSISLQSAIQEALAANRDVAAGERFVAAGEENVKVATSALLPQINLGLTGRIIDQDRAAASLGVLNEQQLTASAGLSQIIYADRAWATKSIERSLQESREQNLETLRLDIAFEAASSYLEVLRRKTVERIQRQNLTLTRANLNLARVRNATGAASPGEVYRWENQIAVNRQAVIESVAGRNITEIILNRLLNRPLEEPFVTLEEDLEDAVLRDGPQLLMAYMTDPWRFRVFREFMSQEAMLASPELRSLGAQIQAQERELTRANRALWLPEFDLVGSLRGFLADGGAGSDFTGLPGFPEDAFATADDVNWSVALRARYPLFTGTRRLAEKARATETLASLDLQREGLSQRIDERLRTSLHLLGASRANVDLSREAADAAGRNYELVRDSYSRGVATIIELLDAQNTALLADLDAATVFYSFLIDLMRSQRAAGTFDYFASDQDREAFMQRLDAYFQSAQLDSGAP